MSEHDKPTQAMSDEQKMWAGKLDYFIECSENGQVQVPRAMLIAFRALLTTAPTADAQAVALPAWFESFLTNVCEIPDRNSPDDEPDAIIATLEELKQCALDAIEAQGESS